LLLLDTEVTSSDTNKEEAKGRNDKAGRPPPGRSETKEEGEEEEEEGTVAAASILSPTKTYCYYWLYLFPHTLSLASVRFFPTLSSSLSSYSLSLSLSLCVSVELAL
jgi:hypothetical protein